MARAQRIRGHRFRFITRDAKSVIQDNERRKAELSKEQPSKNVSDVGLTVNRKKRKGNNAENARSEKKGKGMNVENQEARHVQEEAVDQDSSVERQQHAESSGERHQDESVEEVAVVQDRSIPKAKGKKGKKNKRRCVKKQKGKHKTTAPKIQVTEENSDDGFKSHDSDYAPSEEEDSEEEDSEVTKEIPERRCNNKDDDFYQESGASLSKSDKEVLNLQRDRKNIIPRRALEALIFQISQLIDCRMDWHVEAVDAVQCAAQAELTDIYQKTTMAASHAKRVQINLNDMHLAMNMTGREIVGVNNRAEYDARVKDSHELQMHCVQTDLGSGVFKEMDRNELVESEESDQEEGGEADESLEYEEDEEEEEEEEEENYTCVGN